MFMCILANIMGAIWIISGGVIFTWMCYQVHWVKPRKRK